MRKILPGIFGLLLFTTSCDKDKDMANATIIDMGDVTKDGCGYILRLDNGFEEKPVYLPSNFQQNNLKVKVKYHSSGIHDTCGAQPPLSFFELVIIDDIKKDLD